MISCWINSTWMETTQIFIACCLVALLEKNKNWYELSCACYSCQRIKGATENWIPQNSYEFPLNQTSPTRFLWNMIQWIKRLPLEYFRRISILYKLYGLVWVKIVLVPVLPIFSWSFFTKKNPFLALIKWEMVILSLEEMEKRNEKPEDWEEMSRENKKECSKRAVRSWIHLERAFRSWIHLDVHMWQYKMNVQWCGNVRLSWRWQEKKDLFSAQIVMSRFDKTNTAPWRARIAIQ